MFLNYSLKRGGAGKYFFIVNNLIIDLALNGFKKKVTQTSDFTIFNNIKFGQIFRIR